MSENIIKLGFGIVLEGIAGIILILYGPQWVSALLIIVGIAIIIWGIFGSKDRRDKKKVYNWLYNKATGRSHHKLTIGNYDDDRWQLIKDIADAVNLTPERVREICNVDKRIRRQKEGEYPIPQYQERWGLREFVGNGEPPKIDKILRNKSKVKTSIEDVTNEEWGDEGLISIILDKCFYKEDLQDILQDMNLTVSGNKDDLIDRIIESNRVDIPNLIEIMDKDGLIYMCEMFGLDTTGNKLELKKRILKTKGKRRRI